MIVAPALNWANIVNDRHKMMSSDVARPTRQSSNRDRIRSGTVSAFVWRERCDSRLPTMAKPVSGTIMYAPIHSSTIQPKLNTSDGKPMKVPPLCTVAVRASAHAPSPRLPRKYPCMKSFLSIAFCAIVPNQTEATMNRISANKTANPGEGILVAASANSIGRTPQGEQCRQHAT